MLNITLNELFAWFLDFFAYNTIQALGVMSTKSLTFNIPLLRKLGGFGRKVVYEKSGFKSNFETILGFSKAI